MPRLDGLDTETHQIAGGNFSFTGARIGGLGATEYTLASIALDMSTSVGPFRQDLTEALKTVIAACRKSPRSDNLLVRVVTFSSRHPNGVEEVHGYIPLSEIDVAIYDTLRTGGNTPLYDACFASAGSMNAYAKALNDQDYLCNGITFIVTDGDDNDSSSTPEMVAKEVAKATQSEVMESHLSILIGVNAAQYEAKLRKFQQDAGITGYRSVEDATPGNLAKLADFVSQSISSTSQALGTGGPSQSIAPTI